MSDKLIAALIYLMLAAVAAVGWLVVFPIYIRWATH